MSIVIGFLERILPAQGKYCLAAFYKNKKGVYHTWYDSIQELALQMEHKDASAEAVYHACASYGDEKNKKGSRLRGKLNVRYLRALYCEIDVRADKGYKTKDEALEAVASFVKTSKFPWPTIVDSGGGFHLYWPLTEDIERATWQVYADGLKTYCEKLGLKIDGGIGIDSARILRSPGTMNRKYPNTIVDLLHLSEPSDIKAFSILRLQHHKPTDKAKPVYKNEPVDPELVVAKCNQLRILRDNPEKQSGETWVATARILAQCTGGEKLFHEWSAKDTRYNKDEADKKWGESVLFNNAVTCQRFESINPDGCAGCPLRGKIKTPVHLGRAQQFRLPEEVSTVLTATELPRGYKFDAFGKLMYVTEKQGADGAVEEKITYLTEFPLIVEDQSFNEKSGTGLSITLSQWKPHDGWQVSCIKACEMYKNCEATLCDKGIFVEDIPSIKRYINKCLALLSSQRKTSMSYETFGWKDDGACLYGNKLYSYENGALKTQLVAVTGTASTLANHMQAGGSKKRGSLKDQCAAIQRLAPQGHEWQFNTVLASCAAPLMHWCLKGEGGIIWSTFDREGGKGKTLATIAATTVWGDYEALSTNQSATPKSRINILGSVRHFGYSFDERSQLDPEIAKDFLQTFTGGREGTALKSDRGLNDHNHNWCTVLLTSANHSLLSSIENVAGSQAMADRVFEVQATALPLNKKQFKEDFGLAFKNNCGHLGDFLVRTYVTLHGMDMLVPMLDQAEEWLRENYDFGPQQRYRLALLKCMIVAGTILNEMEMLSFSVAGKIDYLLNGSNLTGEVDRRINMIDIMNQFLNESLPNTLFVTEHNKMTTIEKIPTKELAVRTDKRVIMIGKKYLGWWLRDKDVSTRDFVAELKAQGIVISEHTRSTLGKGTAFNTGQCWCLTIRAEHELVKGVEESNVIDIREAKKR